VRAARGGKSKRGGTSTIGGGGSLFIKFPILGFVFFQCWADFFCLEINKTGNQSNVIKHNNKITKWKRDG
jgi:hypothetical protein